MSDVILVAIITAIAGPGLLVILTRLVNRGTMVAQVTTAGMQLVDNLQEERDGCKRELAQMTTDRDTARRDTRSLLDISRAFISRLTALGEDTTIERQVVDAIDARY